jgi:hypothetical protein
MLLFFLSMLSRIVTLLAAKLSEMFVQILMAAFTDQPVRK